MDALLTWWFAVANGVTAICYFVIPWMLSRSPGGIEVVFAAFILACGLHHLVHVGYIFELHGVRHVAAMYRGPVGLAQLWTDSIMVSISLVAVWKTWRVTYARA